LGKTRFSSSTTCWRKASRRLAKFCSRGCRAPVAPREDCPEFKAKVALAAGQGIRLLGSGYVIIDSLWHGSLQLSEVMQVIPMTAHSGSCLCGAVKFQVEGEFESFYLCHCRRCQKDSGSAHGANLFSRSAELIWRSGVEAVRTFTLAGTRHSRSFCMHCGSPMPNMQDECLLVVPAGCLDSQPTLLPTAHLFSASKAVWDERLEEVPMFEGLPG
jgi:hypothetical protein